MKNTCFPLALIDKKYHVLTRLLSTDSYKSAPNSLVEWINREIIKTQKDPKVILEAINLKRGREERLSFFVSQFQTEMTQQ